MINLLPPETKENFRFAKKNTVLLKWTFGVSLGLVGILLVIGAGWFFLNRSENTYVSLVANTNSRLATEKLSEVQAQSDEISSNLKLVVNVLSREILFSSLLNRVGQILPHGAVLTSLNITQVGGGLDLQAATVNYQIASQLQTNLQDPNNNIFAKADIVSITCQAGGATSLSANYPCKAQYRTQFANNNPFLFINNSSTQAKSKS